MRIRHCIIAALGSACLATAVAEESPYRSPADMSVEERTAVMNRINDYHRCVYEAAMARVDELPDIRQAADEGMAACDDAALAIGELVEGYSFEPGFAEQLVNHARHRAVHKLMPELAVRKSR